MRKLLILLLAVMALPSTANATNYVECEAIYSLIMLDNDFIAASANIEELDPQADGANVITERVDSAGLNCVLSNSFGFGGTNASLAFSRFEE